MSLSAADDARKQAEREIYDRTRVVERPHWDEMWDQTLLGRLEGQEFDPDYEAMATRHLVGKSVAVLGAGAADVAFVRRFTDRILAINISERELDEVRRAVPGTRCLCADIEELKLDEPVDVAFCAAILHHLHPIDAMLDRILGMVRPGGLLFIAREPSLLNPLAAVARVIAPSAEHTPGERPFVFSQLRHKLRARTAPCEEKVYFIFSMLLPYLGRRLPAGRALLGGLVGPSLALESVLRRTRLFDNFFWILRGVYRKPGGGSSS
jgi:2-polyprenyl-3-methyl-5-hydroxy-6-metoxy-1,4-benzoquinol methylase